MHTLPPVRPRRRRQASLEKVSSNSQSCDQLCNSSGDTSKSSSPEKALQSLPKRLSEDNERPNLTGHISRRSHSCEGILEADENYHSQLSLPTPVNTATQTKRKKNFMDKCVNKVRLC